MMSLVVLTSAQQRIHPAGGGRTCRECRQKVMHRCLHSAHRPRHVCREKARHRCVRACQTTMTPPTTTSTTTTPAKPFCNFSCGRKPLRRRNFRRGQRN
ncbi:hypothetical protein EB796_000657 [Bugula neritina]|uniref:Uncharacterized protein n=1 Tax=Bugula neritina TaxID=10212 RepID=A0A7J7KS55_BUGNE|nr:hypothetical protein EB796_000657 [Bugula neritina]